MGIIRNIIGVILILAIAYFASWDRKEIKNRLVNIGVMFVLMFIVAFVSLRTTFGISLLQGISNAFAWLNVQAQGGINFVFGGIMFEEGATVFFFNVLLPIVFFSALIGILDYLKILPFIMKWVGWAINKITGVGELESQYSIMTTMIGQPTAYMTIKDQILAMSGKRLFTFLMTSTSTVAASTLAAYMEMIPGEYVVVAVFLNIFATFIISSFINPYDTATENKYMEEKMNANKPTEIESISEVEEENEVKPNFISVISDYISNGWGLAVAVAATLVGFVAIITFLNNGLDALVGVTFTEVVGYIFSPVAFAIGVPSVDIVEVGSIMAQKLFTNEFVALAEVGNLTGIISEKSLAMISVYCMSFANLGTLGIVTGGIKAISEEKAEIVGGYLGKLLLGATLSSLLVAAIVGMFF